MPSSISFTGGITWSLNTTTTSWGTPMKLVKTLCYRDKEPKDINEFLRMALIDKSVGYIYSYEYQ